MNHQTTQKTRTGETIGDTGGWVRGWKEGEMRRVPHIVDRQTENKKKYIIKIFALKGAIRDFDNLPTVPRTVSNTYAQVARAQSCANHVQHIQRIAQHAVRHVVRRRSSAIELDRVKIAFILASFYCLNRRRRGGNRSILSKPPTTNFRKCQILKAEISNPKRDSNPHSSTGGRLGEQTC